MAQPIWPSKAILASAVFLVAVKGLGGNLIFLQICNLYAIQFHILSCYQCWNLQEYQFWSEHLWICSMKKIWKKHNSILINKQTLYASYVRNLLIVKKTSNSFHVCMNSIKVSVMTFLSQLTRERELAFLARVAKL